MEFAKGMIIGLLVLLSALSASAQDQEASRQRRVAVESAVTLSATAVAIGGALRAGTGAAQRCSRADDGDGELVGWLGCGMKGGMITMDVVFTALPVALTLGSYLSHLALDGRGRWYAALAGAAVGIGGGLGIVSIPAATHDEGAPMVVGAVAAALFAATIPILALELSHGRQERRAKARPSRVAPVATALQGGAWLGVAGRL